MHLGGPIFSPLGDKSSLPKEIFEFKKKFVFPSCSICVPTKFLVVFPTSSQCVNPNMFPMAPHIEWYVLPKIELS
jgi:hypothetical protein